MFTLDQTHNVDVLLGPYVVVREREQWCMRERERERERETEIARERKKVHNESQEYNT